MKRTIVTTICVALAIFFVAGVSLAQALDVNAIFQQIKNELLNKGLTSTDLAAVELPTKSIISQGGNVLDIKSMLLNFAGKGFNSDTLKSLVTMVSDLMKKGDSLKTANTAVTQAVQTASASGLKGDTLIAKVKELISQHQAEIDTVKGAISSKLSGFLKK